MANTRKDQAPYVVIWEFYVKSGQESRFEHIYGPQGDWARLFSQGEGCLGTQLLRDAQKKGRYVTVDAWVSQAACESFRKQHAEEYKTLDDKCEALTVRETPLGAFLRLGPQ